jgi:predicted nucleic acid-binding protein
MTVVDASVWVAWLNEKDVHHAEAVRFLQECEDAGETLRAPALVLPEILGALSRRGASSAFQADVLALFDGPSPVLHEVSRELALEAARLAGTFKLRGCDAIYVALAKSLGERLLTFDAEQGERGLSALQTAVPSGG